MDDKLLDILQNHSLDIDVIQDTLRQVSIRNYMTLHDVQKSMVNISRYDIPFSKLKKITRLNGETEKAEYPRRFVYYIGEDIVINDKRKAFRSSNLFNKPLNQKFISSNKDLFSRNFMVFIDGYFISTCEILVTDGEITVVIDTSNGAESNHVDGIPYDYYKDIESRDATVTILLVPNYSYGYLELNKATFEGKLKYKIGSERITNYNDITTDSILYMNVDTDKSLCTTVSWEFTDDGSIFVDIPSYIETFDTIISQTKIQFHFINIPKMIEYRTISSDCNWFALDNYKMPVPTSSILPFTENNGSLKINHDITIDLFYPNIYRVNGLKDNEIVKLFVYYDKENTVLDSSYKNDLKLLNYLSLNAKVSNNDLLSRYMDNSLPDFIYNYKPINVDWMNGKRYIESIYYPDSVVYNIHTLQDYINNDPDVLIQYLCNRMREVNKYTINVAKLSLESRIRNSTEAENIGNYDLQETIHFNEPMYIFSVRTNFTGRATYDFRIFVDNKYLDNEDCYILKTFDFYHFYIPTRIVNPTTIIEIEKYREYDRLTIIPKDELTYEKPYIVDKPTKEMNNYINVCEVNLVSDFNYINKDMYDIIVHDDHTGEDITLNHNGEGIIKSSFMIKMNTDFYDDKELWVVINRSVTHTRTIIKTQNEQELITRLSVQNNNAASYDRIRMFKNGRLVPQVAYRLTGEALYNQTITVITGLPNEIGDNYSIDALPFSYICEFHLDQIDNEYGFVDTGNSLSFPVDLRWYDIYVNGLRLNKTNIDIITDSKFFIKGIPTLKHLYIYRKSTSYTEFVMNHEDTISNRIYESIDEIRNNLIQDRDIIEDTLDDILTDLVTETMDEMEFISDILEYTFINPNIPQITQKIKDKVPNLIDDHGILYLNCNMDDPMYVTIIDSNIRSEIMKNNQNRYGFTPLHIGSHEDARDGEYMCDPVTGGSGMKSEDGSIISVNLLNRLASHKERMINTMVCKNAPGLAVYHIEPDNNTEVKVIVKETNILDDIVELGRIKQFFVSLDIDILREGYQNVMNFSDYNPTVTLNYSYNNETFTVSLSLETFNSNIISFDSYKDDVTIDSICIVPNSENDTEIDNVKMILNSVLVAF